MKKILRYSRHFMRAKGRHGTHSPFVYAFVEQVMRRKIRVPLLKQRFFSVRELRLLYKTIGYLNPRFIYAPPEWLGVLSMITDNEAVRTATLAMENEYIYEPGTLILAACGNTDPLWLDAVLEKNKEAQVVLFHPHKDRNTTANWKQLCALPGADLCLDYWHFGLLVKDPSFKARQHFRIR